jgi:Spy/CpxP family protein refolding chaperone
MKAIYLLLVVFMLAAVSTQAAVQKKSKDIRKFKTELNLTQEQITQLDAVYNNFQARTRLQAPAENKQKGIQQKRELRKEMRDQVIQVLTPEQRRGYFKLLGAQRVQQKQ